MKLTDRQIGMILRNLDRLSALRCAACSGRGYRTVRATVRVIGVFRIRTLLERECWRCRGTGQPCTDEDIALALVAEQKQREREQTQRGS